MSNKKSYIWYCPRGCQVFESDSAIADNCGSCGAVFSLDDTDYDNSLLVQEKMEIAEFERKEGRG